MLRQNNPELRLIGRWIFLLVGMVGWLYGSSLFAQVPKDLGKMGFSLSLSESFLQTYLTTEYHGQDVSTEKDQAFGFDKMRIQIKTGRVTLTTDFWYKKFISKAKATALIDVKGKCQTMWHYFLSFTIKYNKVYFSSVPSFTLKLRQTTFLLAN